MHCVNASCMSASSSTNENVLPVASATVCIAAASWSVPSLSVCTGAVPLPVLVHANGGTSAS
jgi:hypothetical protein